MMILFDIIESSNQQTQLIRNYIMNTDRLHLIAQAAEKINHTSTILFGGDEDYEVRNLHDSDIQDSGVDYTADLEVF